MLHWSRQGFAQADLTRALGTETSMMLNDSDGAQRQCDNTDPAEKYTHRVKIAPTISDCLMVSQPFEGVVVAVVESRDCGRRLWRTSMNACACSERTRGLVVDKN